MMVQKHDNENGASVIIIKNAIDAALHAIYHNDNKW